MAKFFLHFTANKHEWGFERDFIPLAGDIVNLPFGQKDGEPEGFVEGKVIKRQFYFEEPEDEQVFLDVELTETLPDGCIPHSDAWPSSKYTERREEFKAQFGHYPK